MVIFGDINNYLVQRLFRKEVLSSEGKHKLPRTGKDIV